MMIKTWATQRVRSLTQDPCKVLLINASQERKNNQYGECNEIYLEDGEMPQQLRTPTALVKDPGLLFSTHSGLRLLELQIQDLAPSSGFHGHHLSTQCTYILSGKILMHLK